MNKKINVLQTIRGFLGLRPNQLVLLGSDFINAKFTDINDCPVARAAKRAFKVENVREELVGITIKDGQNKGFYHHEKYGNIEFENDIAQAELVNFNDIVIRKFSLKKLK